MYHAAAGQVDADDLTPEAVNELVALYRRWKED
jgi:hypothetical protein